MVIGVDLGSTKVRAGVEINGIIQKAIVIGGSLSKAFRFFENSMYQSLIDFTFPESIKRLKILQSVNENITLLGAAALINKQKSYSVKVE